VGNHIFSSIDFGGVRSSLSSWTFFKSSRAMNLVEFRRLENSGKSLSPAILLKASAATRNSSFGRCFR